MGGIILPPTLPKITYLTNERGRRKSGLFRVKAQALPMGSPCLSNTYDVLEHIINQKQRRKNVLSKADMYLVSKVCF